MGLQASGYKFRGTFFEEYVYGVEPSNPEGFKFYATRYTLGRQQNLLQSALLTGLPGEAEPDGGNVNPSGDLETELNAEWIVPLLKHTFGEIDTTGVGPYTHVLTPGDLPAGGLTFEGDQGPPITTGRYERVWGVRPATMNVVFPQGDGYITVAWGLRGRNTGLYDVALDAAPLDLVPRSMTSLHARLLEEGGVESAIVTSLNINYSNGLDEDVFALGGGGLRAELPEGRRTVSGSMEVLVRNTTLLAKAQALTETSLKIRAYRGTGDGTANNGSVEFFIPKLKLEPTSIPTDTPQGKRVTFNYRGYQTVAETPLYQVTVKNMSDLAAS
jgi:hypothetical protein